MPRTSLQLGSVSVARSRRYGEDLTYGEWHRQALPDKYGRIGHRIDMADRDWTEYCHYCKTPLALIEEVRDRGQDLLDKGVSVTRNLASLANIQAYLMAWRSERPPEVDREINALHARIRELEAQWPIVGFTIRNLRRQGANLQPLTPDEWLEHLLIIHREHHSECRRATEWKVDGSRLMAVKDGHVLHEVTLFDVLRFAAEGVI
jgi:hypothetical protein